MQIQNINQEIRNLAKLQNRLVESICGVRGEEEVNQCREVEDETIQDVISEKEATREYVASALLDHLIGVAYGLWRLESQQRDFVATELPRLPEPWPSLPPACAFQENAPERIIYLELIADDPDNTDDILRQVRGVLEKILQDRADAIEKEVCETLGVKGLRDYFRTRQGRLLGLSHIPLLEEPSQCSNLLAAPVL
jgi:hypothetical protein